MHRVLGDLINLSIYEHPVSKFVKKRLRSLKVVFGLLPSVFALVWRASYYYTILWAILLVIQGVLPAISIYLTRSVVDGLTLTAGKGFTPATSQTLLLPLAGLLATMITTQIASSLNEWVRTAQSELVQDHVSALIHQQSMTIDYGCYESSEEMDRLERAREGASSRSLSMLESIGSLLQNSLTLISVASMLIFYAAWMPIALIISALPALYIVLSMNRLQYAWSQRTVTDRRRLQYYELLLTMGPTAAELRLFNFGPHFQRRYQQIRQRLRQEQLKLIKKQGFYRLIASFFSFLISGMALLEIGRLFLTGRFSLGDLALFYQAFNQGQGIVRSLLGSLGQIDRNSLFVRNLFEFLQLRPQICDPIAPASPPAKVHQQIQFHNVTFRYPGATIPTLQNFNLTLPADQIVAIVGDNGAGKSTLIKLLCRFYDPEVGSIEIDGMDIRQFCLADLRRMISVLFQFPITYQLTAAENIVLGDIDAPYHLDRATIAAQGSGIHDKLTTLPQGYDSQLGKWFPHGTDLSGGQWQRLALARAFYRQAPVIILDEPTSAMDPWAEHDWLERFRVMAKERTALVITHRFTLAMRADIIHVMRSGQIVESGTHEQLLKTGGLYAQSWADQMQTTKTTTVHHHKRHPDPIAPNGRSATVSANLLTNPSSGYSNNAHQV
jgi:ATP-binding cassette, subfamily B, bacterial